MAAVTNLFFERSKICTQCKELKNFDSFSANSKVKDGKAAKCKTCTSFNYLKSKETDGGKLRQQRRDWRNANREKANLSSRTWYHKVKDTLDKKKASLTSRKRSLRVNYNLTLEEYNDLFNLQEGSCKVCHTHQSQLNKNLAVDHCHTTGKVRGLLCDKCNMSLGLVNDSEEILVAMINYLRSSK